MRGRILCSRATTQAQRSAASYLFRQHAARTEARGSVSVLTSSSSVLSSSSNLSVLCSAVLVASNNTDAANSTRRAAHGENSTRRAAHGENSTRRAAPGENSTRRAVCSPTYQQPRQAQSRAAPLSASEPLTAPPCTIDSLPDELLSTAILMYLDLPSLARWCTVWLVVHRRTTATEMPGV